MFEKGSGGRERGASGMGAATVGWDLGDSHGLWAAKNYRRGVGSQGGEISSIRTNRYGLMNDFAEPGAGAGNGSVFCSLPLPLLLLLLLGRWPRKGVGISASDDMAFFPPCERGIERSSLIVCSSNALPSESAGPANSETCIPSERGRLGGGEVMRT